MQRQSSEGGLTWLDCKWSTTHCSLHKSFESNSSGNKHFSTALDLYEYSTKWPTCSKILKIESFAFRVNWVCVRFLSLSLKKMIFGRKIEGIFSGIWPFFFVLYFLFHRIIAEFWLGVSTDSWGHSAHAFAFYTVIV